jgi:glycosyltransferase involved in cell wall biosynthesis
MNASIAIYLVTYRRPEMLKRAIRSVLAQSHQNWTLRIVNDDPIDGSVGSFIADIDDPRVHLFEPEMKRGATVNFNLLSFESEAEFVCLLEDDNWWEPEFLVEMVSIMERNPWTTVAVGNERLWLELPSGEWQNTEHTIWDFSDEKIHEYNILDLCGSAKLCNSSMLIRTAAVASYRTPDTIPVDVTEHFRERMFPKRIVLNGKPLVNYAITLETARGKGDRWGLYQVMLISSVFEALSSERLRSELATRLWQGVDSPYSPRATILIEAGIASSAARALFKLAPIPTHLKRHLRNLKRFVQGQKKTESIQNFDAEMHFLTNAPLVRELALEMQKSNPD